MRNKTVIECETFEEVEKLLKSCILKNEYDLTPENIWNRCYNCVNVDENGFFISYGSRQGYEQLGCKIIKFSDFELADNVNEKDDLQNEYNRGLHDAWELAKKIVLPEKDGGLSSKDFFVVFRGFTSCDEVLKEFSPQKAMQVFKSYKEKELLRINDEVVLRGNLKGVITYVHSDGTVDILLQNGLTSRHEKPEDLKKTGHVINVSALLGQLCKENDADIETKQDRE